MIKRKDMYSLKKNKNDTDYQFVIHTIRQVGLGATRGAPDLVGRSRSWLRVGGTSAA